MNHKAEVEDLLKQSEARTGNYISFIVGHSPKVGYVQITVVSKRGPDHTLEADLQEGLTDNNRKLILDWFEPLAAADV